MRSRTHLRDALDLVLRQHYRLVQPIGDFDTYAGDCAVQWQHEHAITLFTTDNSRERDSKHPVDQHEREEG